jgi:hypothetical protein
MTAPVRERLSAPWAALVGVLAAIAADVAFDPSRRHVPLCPFHALTGWDCPLCGGLRAADALVHGRLGTAVHDNVLLVVALPLLAGYWYAWASRGATPRLGRRGVIAVVGVLVLFTVLRNVVAALRP